MKRQAFNPYLPENEYIPDGEPHVFGDRVYVYGSHDRFNAPFFCMNDYVCYSAPTDDLSNWRYEGVIYRKKQDPKNKLGLHLFFAPDVTCGPDGRYYLYYTLGFGGIMGVAVCDTPAGEYKFHGHVSHSDGRLWGRCKGDQYPFDPGVLTDDDGRVYLYSGFYTELPAIVTGFHKLKFDGGVVVELEQDMITMKGKPKLLFPKHGEGSFENHEFFEASSIRKKDGKYIFVYSSVHNHELCYAISDYPDRDFEFGGTLVSQGDLFLDGNKDESKALNYLGNTHGGVEEINGQWYVFYHRQTNQHSYSRQACAEKLLMDEKVHFQQAEVTSCGLNNGPLSGVGTYEARIACHLYSKDGVCRYDVRLSKKELAKHPYFTQTGKDGDSNAKQYIANMRDGAVAGFKYFELEELNEISINVQSAGEGTMAVATDREFSNVIAEIPVSQNKASMNFTGTVQNKNSSGVYPLYFRYTGSGVIDFYSFELK